MQLGADYRAFGADVEALTGSELGAKLVPPVAATATQDSGTKLA